MRKLFIMIMVCPGLCPGYNLAQELPAKDTVLKHMIVANKYFMDKWPDPGQDIVTDKVRPSNLWTRATYYEGLMALYYLTKDTDYYQYAVDWGESHNWMPTYGNLNTRDADHQCCGQTYIELFLIDNQYKRIEPIKQCIDNRVASDLKDDWSWIDAIQMAMPLYAKLGVVLNDTAYFRKMHDLYMFSKNNHGDSGLYNKHEHLWWRDKDFVPPYQTPNEKNCYWSRGNGWVLAALARVLDVVPDTLEYNQEYITTFKEMSAALIKIQREDGFWNSSLVDENDYGGKETSGTAFFTYGLAWGINNQLLDSTVYMPHVIKAWNGMVNDALHPNGFLGYVQGTGKQPSDGQPLSYTKPANFEDYGLGAFLLAGSEVYHLAPESVTLTETNSPKYDSDSRINVMHYPNPVNDQLNIHFILHSASQVIINIYDLQGKIVNSVYYNSQQEPGEYLISSGCFFPDGKKLPKGIYFVSFVFSNDVVTKKIIMS